MSGKSENPDEQIMQSLSGVRRLKNDKVDLYQDTPRKKSFKINDINTGSPELPFQHISHQLPETTHETWFHHGMQKKLRRKIKNGLLSIDAILDLHGHNRHEAIQELQLFMQDALNSQARMLLIIHGKGFNSQVEAVLRPLVQHWLSEQTMVLAYCPAQARDGGFGASYVYLKSQN